MISIAHIINPVVVPPSSDLYIAQPITFESMRRAKDFAEGKVNVTIYTIQYEEDIKIIPNDFIPLSNLERSVLDVGQFKVKRKLPLLFDIIWKAYNETTAEYVIYTNVDISLQESFYVAVSLLIEKGYDAFVINRRTISKNYSKLEELPLMYEEKGLTHPGHDCFIFKREIIPILKLDNVCIGASWVGRVMIWNLYTYSSCFFEFANEKLTFHIGDDRHWSSSSFDEYLYHNTIQAQEVHKRIKLYRKKNKLKRRKNYIDFELRSSLKNYPLSKVEYEEYLLNRLDISRYVKKLINNSKTYIKYVFK